MKSKFLLPFFILFLAACCFSAIQAQERNQFSGYVSTSDINTKTGTIFLSEGSLRNSATYIDFGPQNSPVGSKYWAEDIIGFGYQKNDQWFHYRSHKIEEDEWGFFKLEARPGFLELYSRPKTGSREEVKRDPFTGKVIARYPGLEKYEVEHTYLYRKDLGLKRIQKILFKETLAPFIADNIELCEQIGQPGYRIKNLESIVNKYNDWLIGFDTCRAKIDAFSHESRMIDGYLITVNQDSVKGKLKVNKFGIEVYNGIRRPDYFSFREILQFTLKDKEQQLKKYVRHESLMADEVRSIVLDSPKVDGNLKLYHHIDYKIQSNTNSGKTEWQSFPVEKWFLGVNDYAVFELKEDSFLSILKAVCSKEQIIKIENSNFDFQQITELIRLLNLSPD